MKLRIGLTTVASSLLVAIVGCSDEGGDPCASPSAWCEFGRDPENSRNNQVETAISKDTVDQLELAWEYPDPSSGESFGVTSTPMVAGDTVYIGTWQNDVVALNASTGAERWRTDVEAVVDSTLAVTADRVYASDGAGFVHALSRRSGERLWETRVDDSSNSLHLYSSPRYIEDANLIVVGVASLEVVGGQADYSFRGSVVALDADSGDQAWQVYLTEGNETSGTGVSVWSTAAIDAERNLIFIGTGQNYEPPASPHSDALVAIDYEAGEHVWTRQFTEDDVFVIFGDDTQIGPDYDVGASPNLYQIGDRDVVGVADKRGVYSTLDRDTGETVWAEMLGPGSSLGGVMSTAVYDEGNIYVASNEYEGGMEDFAAEGNVAHLYSLDAATGDPNWTVDIPTPNFGALTMANGVLFVGTVGGEVFAVDPANGDTLWMVDDLEDVGGGVSVADGTLFVPHGFTFFGTAGTTPGGLRAYRLP
ncbi:MAG: PQQ-binding-like beta-propeller repeat protein [Myxococcota bacterium]